MVDTIHCTCRGGRLVPDESNVKGPLLIAVDRDPPLRMAQARPFSGVPPPTPAAPAPAPAQRSSLAVVLPTTATLVALFWLLSWRVCVTRGKKSRQAVAPAASSTHREVEVDGRPAPSQPRALLSLRYPPWQQPPLVAARSAVEASYAVAGQAPPQATAVVRTDSAVLHAGLNGLAAGVDGGLHDQQNNMPVADTGSPGYSTDRCRSSLSDSLVRMHVAQRPTRDVTAHVPPQLLVPSSVSLSTLGVARVQLAPMLDESSLARALNAHSDHETGRVFGRDGRAASGRPFLALTAAERPLRVGALRDGARLRSETSPCERAGPFLALAAAQYPSRSRAGVLSHEGRRRRAASGLRWRRCCGEAAPIDGRELRNGALAAALTTRTTFTPEEWVGFGMPDLCADHYIYSAGAWFEPDSGTTAPLGTVSGVATGLRAATLP